MMVNGWSDASHGKPKPMAGHVLYAWGGPWAWKSAKLPSTPISTCEGEWFAAARLAMAIQAEKPVAEFMGVPMTDPVPIYCDNKAACLLAESNLSSKRMRHVLVRLHYLKERVEDKEVLLKHVGTSAQIADIFTKSTFTPNTFHSLRERMLR